MSNESLNEERRIHYIRLAGVIALAGNALLAATKLALGFFANSLAVIGDGVDSSTDVLIALITLIISGIISRPGDQEHPWGHGRAETTATMALAFIIFFAGAELVISSVKQLISGTISQDTSLLAILAAAISITGKSILAFIESQLGKKSDSEMVKANAQNMMNDIILSAGVLIGLASAHFFKCPILDPIVAIVVGLWVVKNAVHIFAQMNTELMDGNTDDSLYQKLFDAAMSVPGVSNPHRARIRKIASRWDIDLDIEVRADMTVHAAHEISEKVEKAVRKAIPDVYDIMVHIEPAGHAGHHPVEQYGVTPESLKEDEEKKEKLE
jgi:cation diffusion facilitator family transporter